MLKEAIEKIAELSAPTIVELNGAHYAVSLEGEAKQIMPELVYAECKELNSLDALALMVREEAVPMYGKVFINVPTHLRAEAFLEPNEDLRKLRQTIYNVNATDVPGWDAEMKLPFDRAAVALQTRFQDSEDREYTLQLLSQISTGAKVTYNDTGVATTIVTQRGVSLQQNSTIRPIVKLRPYRTFQELEQPSGLFLIRIDERGISFAEADGGMWKLAARKSIKAYLEAALASEIDSGNVRVML